LGRALGEGRPVRARRTTVPLDRRDHRTPKRIQSVVVFYPTHDDQQVVSPIDVDDVLAVADEVHAGRGVAWSGSRLGFSYRRAKPTSDVAGPGVGARAIHFSEATSRHAHLPPRKKS
jgi:hypothetical protein